MVFETVIDKETKREFEVKSTKSGENPQPCPSCSHDRKKKNSQCFSYNSQLGVGKCQHCGLVVYKRSEDQPVYVRPKFENKTELSDKALTWFQQRNISQDVLYRMGVYSGSEFMPQVQAERTVICFPYFRNGQLINLKYRDGAKNFKMVKGAEKILFNLDAIKAVTEAYIVEGEIDCLTMIQSGYQNTVSVPNGATKGKNNLEYLDNSWEYFESLQKVYILTDHDENGEALANELARRIGVEKCYRIHLGGHKDVNEQLCKTGKVDISDARPYPLSGVFSVNDHWEELMLIIRNGFPEGWRPREPIGKQISFYPGYTTIITGIPGHGKSEIVDQMLIWLSLDYNLKGCFFTPENWPSALHSIKHIEKLIGKSAFKCNPNELEQSRQFFSDHFYWVYPEEDYSLDTILLKIRQAVLKYGVNWYVLDPWNKLEHKRNGLSETDYVSISLDKISNFNKKNGTHCFLVVHPTKMKFTEDGKYEVPGLYDISGSANWYNKADVGMTMYKDEPGVNTLYIQKVKFKYWGEIGTVPMLWDQDNGRYFSVNPDRSNWLNPVRERVIDFSEPFKHDDNDEMPF
jgi:twinkle protein